MATELELAWAGGFLDGEGCFSAGYSATRRIWWHSISAAQNDRAPLDLLQEIFGAGSVHRRTDRASAWHVGGARQIKQVIPLVRPYLRVKGSAADALLALVEHRVSGGQRIGAAGHDERLELLAALKATRGPVLHRIKT